MTEQQPPPGLGPLLRDAVPPGSVAWEGVLARSRQRRRRRRALGVLAVAPVVLAAVLLVPATRHVSRDPLLSTPPVPTPTSVSSSSASPSSAPPRPPAGPPLLVTVPLDDRYELRITDDDVSDQTGSVLRLLGDGPVRDVTPPGWDERWQVVDAVLAHGRLWLAVGETCGLGQAGRAYTSGDLGRTWRRADGLPGPGCHAGDGGHLVVDDADRATLDVYSYLVDSDVTVGTRDGGRTWSREETPNAGRVAAGPGPNAPCDAQHTPVVVLRLGPDTPRPRCVGVVPRQRLRVVNEQAGRVTVSFAGQPSRRLDPGESTLYDTPMGDLVRSGSHELRVTDTYGAEVLLRGTAGDDRAG